MIKKINKRFIASSIALTLIPSVLSGCSISKSINSKNESRVEKTSNSGFNFYKNCYYIEIYNCSSYEVECYISNRNEINDNGKSGYKYRDLISDKYVYMREKDSYDYLYWTPEEIQRKFMCEIKLEDYLYEMNMVKENYTVEDIKYVLDEMKQISDDKKLVKE